MKRFVETSKWHDSWHIRLSPVAKLLWDFCCCHCNQIGLIEIDLTTASFFIGGKVTQEHIAELGDRLQHLASPGKYFIPKFIHFQYGELSTACGPHRTILKMISQHGLTRVGLLYHYPSATPPTTPLCPARQDKNGSGSEEGVQGEVEPVDIYHKDSRAALHWLNEKSGHHYRETDVNLGFISARLKEKGVDIEGVKKMIERQCRRWLGTSQAEYLRPQTLFNATKFDGYYAAKDEPVANQMQPDWRKDPNHKLW